MEVVGKGANGTSAAANEDPPILSKPLISASSPKRNVSWKASPAGWVKIESKIEEQGEIKTKFADEDKTLCLSNVESEVDEKPHKRLDLPALEVPEGQSELATRAIYNRHVTTPSMMGMGNLSPSSPDELVHNHVDSGKPDSLVEHSVAVASTAVSADGGQDVIAANDALPQRTRRKRDKQTDNEVGEVKEEVQIENEPPHAPEQTISNDDNHYDDWPDIPASANNPQVNKKKVRDKSNDTYATVTSSNAGLSATLKVLAPKTEIATRIYGTDRSTGVGVQPVYGQKSQYRPGSVPPPLGNFSSSMIPKDHRKFHPQGWVQAEFSDRSLDADRSRAKEHIRNLERAWQLRIDLDEKQASELDEKLIVCQEAVGNFTANMSITSRELSQQFQLLEPLKNIAKEAVDERAQCTQEIKEMFENAKKRFDPFEDFKTLSQSMNFRDLKDSGSIDQHLYRIHSEFETSVAGSDARHAMLKDKPNISAGGLRKVTNDSSSLLRAERENIRTMQELKKVAPMLERREEDKAAFNKKKLELENIREQANQKIIAVNTERQKIRDRIAQLKQVEAEQRSQFGELERERNALKNKISSLRFEIKAELAERNKQRERYRFLISQEEEVQLRHKMRQDEMAGCNEDELKCLREAVENARLAKEEAEAHARMLQSSIVHFERLKADVEALIPAPAPCKSPILSSFADEGEAVGIPRDGWSRLSAPTESSPIPGQESAGKNAAESAAQPPMPAGELLEPVSVKTGKVTKDVSNERQQRAAKPQNSVTSKVVDPFSAQQVSAATALPEPATVHVGFGDQSSLQSAAKVEVLEDKQMDSTLSNAKLGTATPLRVERTEEQDTSSDGEGEGLYRSAYNAQIYTPSMGENDRQHIRADFFEGDGCSPMGTAAIPVFKARNKLQEAVRPVATTAVDPLLAAEFEEELQVTIGRLFDIKAEEEKRMAPELVMRGKAKIAKAAPVPVEDGKSSDSEEVAPLGRLDPAFQAFRQEIEQDVDVASIREKEKERREQRLARQERVQEQRRAAKASQPVEPAKSGGLLSTLLAVAPVVDARADSEPARDNSHTSEKERDKARAVGGGGKTHATNRKGKKKRRTGKLQTGESESDGQSEGESAVKMSQDAIKLAVARSKRKEADRRFWKYCVLVVTLVLLGGLLSFALYQSVALDVSRADRPLTPAQRSRMATSVPRPPVAGKEEVPVGKEALLEMTVQGADRNKLSEPLRIYHGLGDPGGVRRDVHRYVQRLQLPQNAEGELYSAVIQQLERRVREVPMSPPASPPGQESDVGGQDDLEEEEEEEARDPEDDESEDRAAAQRLYREAEAEDASPPQPSPPRAGMRFPDAERFDSPRPSSPSGVESARADWQRPAGQAVREPLLEIKMKTAAGDYLPPLPIFEDSTEESIRSQAASFIAQHHVDMSVDKLTSMAMARLHKRLARRSRRRGHK